MYQLNVTTILQVIQVAKHRYYVSGLFSSSLQTNHLLTTFRRHLKTKAFCFRNVASEWSVLCDDGKNPGIYYWCFRCLSVYRYISLSLHWLCGPCRTLVSFWINFQASLSLTIFLQPLTPVFFKSFWTLSNHLFHDFPKNHLPPGVLLDTFFTAISSDILSTCPNHLTFLLWFRFGC